MRAHTPHSITMNYVAYDQWCVIVLTFCVNTIAYVAYDQCVIVLTFVLIP